MKIEKSRKFAIMVVSALFVIFYSANFLNSSLSAQFLQISSENNANLTSPSNFTEIRNDTESIIDNAIAYVLNVTTTSDSTSQAVDEIIQAIGGDRSTSMQQAIEASSKGNLSAHRLNGLWP